MRPSRTNPVLLVIVVEGFLSRLSFGLISFALPLYAYRLGVSLPAIGFLLSLNLAVAIVLKPMAGSLVDRVGMKLGLLGAMALRSLVTLLLAFATVPWQLFATRTIHGVSISVRDPAVNVLLAEAGGKKTVATAFAWYQTAKSLAGALGKVMAGVLLGLTAANFSIVFAVAFALSAVPIAIVALFLPNARSSAVSATEAVEMEAPQPAEPAPAMLPFMSLGFLVSGTAYMLANLFPIFAVAYGGLSEAQAGAIYSLSAIVVLAGPGFGWLSDHVSRKLVLSIRSAANVLSSVVYLVAPNLAGMATGRVVDDLGKAAFRPGWGALMAHVASFDKRRRARTMGYLSAGEDAGEVTGPILAGFLWSTWGAPALLGARIVLAIATEVYTIALTRRLTGSVAPGGRRRPLREWRETRARRREEEQAWLAEVYRHSWRVKLELRRVAADRSGPIQLLDALRDRGAASQRRRSSRGGPKRKSYAGKKGNHEDVDRLPGDGGSAERETAGVIGRVDLDAFEAHAGAVKPVRPCDGASADGPLVRIPPRVRDSDRVLVGPGQYAVVRIVPPPDRLAVRMLASAGLLVALGFLLYLLTV
jgi:MFS family permease